MRWTRKAPRLCASLTGALLAFAFATGPALADSVMTTISNGFGRALFTLAPFAKPVATVKDGVLIIRFDRKVAVSARAIANGLSPYISSAREDGDGRTLRFALRRHVRLHSSVSADRYALDLVPASFAGTPPNLPPPPAPKPKAVNVAKLPPLEIRAGAYTHFARLVFDWHKKVPYAVFPGDHRIMIRFESEARPNFKALEHVAPPWVKQAGWRIAKGGTEIEFNTESNSGYHDFRDGTHIVLDILAPKTDAAAYNPPGGSGKAGPGANVVLTKADTSSDSALGATQAATILATAARLDNKSAAVPSPRPNSKTASVKTPAAKQADAKQADSKDATAKSAPPKSNLQSADAHLTRRGATLTFPGAGDHGAAVFVRGMTAWIVLDGAHAIDPATLKSALGDFPSSVDASTGDGVSVLRIGLKSPEEIAADADGATLKVVLAPKVHEKATGIALSRDDDDPRRPALATVLPGARHAVTLGDPDAGDMLEVVPGDAGRAMLAKRRYVDFAALPSAAGLVLTPFADDLHVAVHDMRVRITRPDGLTLTAPQLPPATSPAALAQSGDGPCYIDFKAWSHPLQGSFVRQAQILRNDAAKLAPDKANPARLTLARFYIANEFGAEALGMINLMQSSDPSLENDKQLQTIRAAADVMMARYQDAYNALAGSIFDNNRHAALWRGLAEAGMQQWTRARASLLKAMPVLNRYPPDWQARVRIAYANAAIHAGALEAADTSLGHLHQNMPMSLALDSELARGRLYAAEGRYHDAHALFVDVQTQNKNPQAAAHAIYDDVVAGLAAGAVTQNEAIDRLEDLRFRWRGDSIELDTLRKLSALYFGEKHWRDGLQTLRIATRSFPNNDLARQAQDDMRHAFVQLFLKGQADKMPPIQALALFYDFIDLTPIGADGDEMIRHMANRLVNVDLLGPAETLLKYQVDKRLNGVARAQVATRLAMIDLLDHKAKDALAALRSTRIAGLPDNLAHQRLLLEARALASLKQWDQALAMIAVDNAPDTRRLRADIYWESGNWAVAAQKAEELLGNRWSDPKPLTAEERNDVMRAAISYSLANNEAGLDRLRTHFAAKMKASSDASAFAVVTQRIDTQGVAFRDVAGKIASIDTLESFMKDFKKRYGSAPATN